MRVLVTGGAGYLGSVVSHELLGRGHQVCILDSLRYGGEPLLALGLHDNFCFIQGDIRSRGLNERLPGPFDAVVYLAAINNPELIRDGACTFGSQCIVLYVEAKQRGPGKYECLTDNARERSGLDVLDWVRRAVDLGAGEVLITSVDREGTGKGYDIELTASVADLVDVPVIACGGAGSIAHVEEAITAGKANAVAAASLLHYGLVEEMAQLETSFEEGNTEFLRGRLPINALTRRSIAPTSVSELKGALSRSGISVREALTLTRQEGSMAGSKVST